MLTNETKVFHFNTRPNILGGMVHITGTSVMKDDLGYWVVMNGSATVGHMDGAHFALYETTVNGETTRDAGER